jgi:GT2 family glycosyltransferase
MFSIIIPTWNNLKYVQNCVRSIRENSRHEHEIIVHVNDGSDGSLDWVVAEKIKHTQSPDNIGICLAVNEAASLSTTQYIVYMNDDMYVLPNWDTALIDQIPEERTSPFVLSGTMIEPKPTNNPCVIVANHGDSLESFDEQGLLSQYATYQHADWAGASWPPTLVHRRWWHMVGGYSTELSPGMASDTDFAMKMWAAGCRVFHGVSDSRVYHFQCRSTGRVEKNDGSAQFLSKWGMSQSTFSKHYLRRGTEYTGASQPPDGGDMKRLSIKAGIKRRFGKLFTPFY